MDGYECRGSRWWAATRGGEPDVTLGCERRLVDGGGDCWAVGKFGLGEGERGQR